MLPGPSYIAPPLAARPRRRLFRWWLVKWAIVLTVWGSLAIGAALLWFAWDLPRPEAALDAARRPSLTLQDRTGHIYATFGDVVGDPLRLVGHASRAARSRGRGGGPAFL